MKKLLSFMSLFLIAIGSFTQSFTIGDLTYSVLSATDKTVSVSNGNNATGDVVVPEIVIYDDVEYSVTTIGSYAFNGNKNITSVNLPSATSIGSDAFSGCSSLASANLPSATSIGSYAFFNCSNISSLRIGSAEQWCKVNFGGSYSNPLQGTSQQVDLYIGESETPATSVELPSTVTEIPNYAFSRTTITSVSAPSATSIGSYAFFNCSSLASANLPSATSIGSYAFFNCSSFASANLPSTTSIGSSAFQGCSNISSLRIGSAEQWCKVNFGGSYSNPLQGTSQQVDLYIGESETPATSVELPSTVTEIPHNAFRSTTITSVSAPSATSIGSYAFFNCSSLASANLPSATSIGSYAFRGCSSLASANLPSATSIGSEVFQDCSSLASANLPSATSIGSEAFLNCSSLASANLPSATSIGSGAFYKCYSLASANLPSATYIGSNAFGGCSIKSLRIGSVEQYCNIEYANKDVSSWNYPYQFPLQSDRNMNIYIGDSETPAIEITIPASVKQVPDYAFRGTSIHTIHFEGTNPPALINTRSFPTWTMLAVPEEAYETYLAADVYKTIPLQITIDGHLTKVVDMEADATTSKLLMKIGEDEIGKIVNLTIKGTINSYDMMIIRNQMTSLRNLDLTDASIVDCDFVYSNADGVNYRSQKDVITADWLSGLMNVKLPATTKSIGNKAFYSCSSLVGVTIPEGVTSIGSKAFEGCRSIKELTLPQSVTSVGSYAFYDCKGLKEVVIPDVMTSIGSYAFYSSDLEKVTIPASVTSIGSYAFCDNKPLELHISSLEAWNCTKFSGIAFRDVSKLYIGEMEEPVEDIVIPEGTASLSNYAFAGFKCIKSLSFPAELSTIGKGAFQNCSGLTEIKLPENVKAINSYTFSGCSNLENVEFTDSIKTVDSYAFENCSKLTKIELPAYLQTISSYAFRGCSNLTEVLIPASIKEVKDYAFQSCPNLNRVIATTVEPIVINQNTFSTYKTASLFTPKTSYYKYYWNTQWNQFLARNEYDKEYAKSFGYKYFYLNGQNGDQKEDFEISDETGTIHGIRDKKPNADFNEGAGVIVGGEQVQELGDIHIHHNGNNGASVITKQNGKVHIDNLYVDIKVQKNRWYFFCFPFDINPGEAKFGGSHVWYLYDGETRAMNGNGGWKKVAADGVMKLGNGYIFQGAVNGTLSIHVAGVTIDASDSKTNMIAYQSENKNDASWNLIGNPNIAYYDMANLGYEAPITVYNNETGNYEAVRPGDDEYEFYPFQAFFVQKPEGTATMDFDGSKKDTKNKADQKTARRAAARANAPRKADSLRKVINLEVVSDADSVSSSVDRTRIVINPTKSLGYETDCDAAKFVADNMPQIYSLDNEGNTYAINERPMENGIVNIAVKAAKKGLLTISASRLDCGAKLRDLEAGEEVDLAEGGYTFAADATTYTNRFQLILGGETTSVSAPEVAVDVIDVESGAIRVNDASAVVKVYSVGGALIASQKGSGSINVPTGTYVVTVNGQSKKIIVK